MKTTSSRVPVELAEAIIDDLGSEGRGDTGVDYHLRTLRSCALVCKTWLPRSRYHLFRSVNVESALQFKNICTSFHTSPSLQSLVECVAVSVEARTRRGSLEGENRPLDDSDVKHRAFHEAAAVVFLSMLPNLRTYKLTGAKPFPQQQVYLSQISLACFSRFSSIRCLTLENLMISNGVKLVRLLGSLPYLQDLELTRIKIHSPLSNFMRTEQATAVIKTLEERLRCSHLKVFNTRCEELIGLLFHPCILPRWTRVSIDNRTLRSDRLSGVTLADFPHLHSISISIFDLFPRVSQENEAASALQKAFALMLGDTNPPRTLRSVELVFPGLASEKVRNLFHSEDVSRHCREIEAVLLRPAYTNHIATTFRIPRAKRNVVQRCITALQLAFPTLHSRNILRVECPTETGLPHKGHHGGVAAIAVDHLGEVAVTAGGAWDSSIIVWDIESREPVRQWSWSLDSDLPVLAFAPDNVRLASAGDLKGNIQIWDSSQGTHLATLATGPHSGSVTCIAWSPDGTVLASGASLDRTVCIWDPQTCLPLHILSGHETSIEHLVISPNGRWLMTCGELCGGRVWDIKTGELRVGLATGEDHIVTIRLRVVMFDQESKTLIALNRHGYILRWSAETGELLCYAVLQQPSGKVPWPVFLAALSRDGRRAIWISGDEDTKARVADTATGALLWTLDGHERDFFRLSMSPDGEYAATSTGDYPLRLWRMSDGKCVATMSDPEKRLCRQVFTEEGGVLVSGAGDGTVWIAKISELIAEEKMWISE